MCMCVHTHVHACAHRHAFVHTCAYTIYQVHLVLSCVLMFRVDHLGLDCLPQNLFFLQPLWVKPCKVFPDLCWHRVTCGHCANLVHTTISLRFHGCSNSVMSKWCSLTVGIRVLSLPLLQCSLSLRHRVYVVEIPTRTEHPTITYSLYSNQLWISTEAFFSSKSKLL